VACKARKFLRTSPGLLKPLSKMLVEKIIQHDVKEHKEHLELNAHLIVALPCLIVEAEGLRHIVDNHWYIRGDEEEPGDADQLVKVVLGFDGVGKRVGPVGGCWRDTGDLVLGFASDATLNSEENQAVETH
jgi:hypothetical protein